MTKNEFDERAKTWDKNPERAQRAADVARIISETIELNVDLTVLEYGCGTGLLGLTLKPKIGKLVLTDVSKGMLEVVNDKLRMSSIPNTSSACLDLSDPDWEKTTEVEPASIDVIITMMVLHHVDDVAGVLDGFTKLIRQGGHLFIADLDVENGFHGPDAKVPHKGFDRTEMSAQVNDLGFREIAKTTAFSICKTGENGEEREFPVFLLGFVKL